MSAADPLVVAEVEAVNAQFYAAFEHADLDAMHRLWAGSDDLETAASVVCIHPGWDRVAGRQRVLRSWALVLANTDYIQFVLTGVEVTVLGSTAVVHCTENILTDPGQAAGDATLVATNVFVRELTGWRLLVHHGSPVLASG